MVTAYNEIVVPAGTPDGIYNHAILENGTAILHFKPFDSTKAFRKIKNFVKVVNINTTISPSPAVVSRISKRAPPEKSLHCSVNYAYGDEYNNMVEAEEAYKEYISKFTGIYNTQRELSGNSFAVRGHGVGYGCMFGGQKHMFSGQNYADYMQIINQYCGIANKGYYNTNYDAVGWGRVRTDEPFCGGGGIPYGYNGYT